MRKILFACWNFGIGGHSSYTLNFARAYRQRQSIVGALVPEPFGELYGDFREILDDVEVVRRGLEARSAYLRRLLRRIVAWQPDVLINSAIPMVQAVMPFLPENCLRISVVHSIIECEAALANGAWVDWVVAVSDNLREKLEQESAGAVRLATIPVGLEIPPDRRRRERASKPLRLIYVGRLEPEKNLPGLFRVLATLDKASAPFFMTIAGAGRELNAVRSQIENLGIAEKVRFLGARSPREVGMLLDENDFLLLTSYYEGTPHAALEAMARGLVVLVSRLPGSTDRIITHGVDGFLCDHRRPQEYVTVLQRLVNQPSEFATVSKAARRTVLSRYSADACAAQYEPLFEGGATSNRRRSLILNGPISIPPGLRPNFPGIVLQCRHRLADMWRGLVQGRRPAQLTKRR